MFKKVPQALATSEALYDEFLPLDPALQQDFGLGDFGDHCLPTLRDPECSPLLAPGLRKRKREVEGKDLKPSKKSKESYKHHCKKQRCNGKWNPTEGGAAMARDCLPSDANTRVSSPPDADIQTSFPLDVKTQTSLPTDDKTRISLPTDTKTQTQTSLTSDIKIWSSLPTDAKVLSSLPTDAKTQTSLTSNIKIQSSLPTDAKVQSSLPTDAKVQSSLPTDAKVQASLPTDANAQTSLPTDASAQAASTQCLGPSCVQPAQPGSKYCSSECGMKLAAHRLFQILPGQLQQWQQSPCVADHQARALLEQLGREQEATWRQLQDVERRSQELEALIRRAQQQGVGGASEPEEGDERQWNHQVFCVSCGHPTSLKGALRHMEHCYAKFERQASSESECPKEMGGATPLFCNIYDPKSKTYCHRLRVLCPEHSREPKEPAEGVCGCPLVREVFEPTGAFCPLPKGRCRWHHAWEKLQRAELDLERVRAWDKLERLREQEQKVRQAQASRGGLLALLLHRTIQHDPLTSDLRTHAHH